jgi:RecA-family ATPase
VSARPTNGAGQTEPVQPSPIIWSTLVGEPPPRTWWIPDWLSPNATLLAGSGGVGKTLLAQAIGTALATNRPYFSTATKPLTCLMWLCEDDHDEIWRRQVAINAYLSVTMDDLKRLHIIPRVGCDNTLYAVSSFGKAAPTTLFHGELRDQCNDLKADVLVLDNIAQVFGGNSVDPHQVTGFVNSTQGIGMGREFAAIFTGHTARSAGSEYYGSAAWENACRMRWYLGATLPGQKIKDDDEGEESDTIFLARRKANYTEKDFLKMHYQRGLLIPETHVTARRLDEFGRREIVDRVFMKGFRRLDEAGIVGTDSPNAGDYAPKQIIEKGYAEGCSKKELTDAMNRLMGTGRLKRDPTAGRYTNRSVKPGLVEVRQ